MKKEKCYFYSEFHDMGASIPCCNLHDGLGVCPCEDCDKFLSRADAFDIILNHINGEDRPTGHWIYRREDKYSCSKCSNTTRVDESGIDEKPMYKFCPYCGAKME